MHSRKLAPLIMILLAASTAHAARPLRLASLAPQDSAWGRLIQELSSEVKKATKGDIKFQLFLGGTLGDEAKVAKRLGRSLDGSFMTGQGIGLLLPAFRVQELPFLVESHEEADKVRKAIWPLLEEAFEKETKFVLLKPGETGMIHIFSQHPVKTVDDLKKAKLWVWEGDSIAADTFRVFGVSPRPLDILTVVQQLKSGGIDTVYNSPAGAVALGWTGDLSYVTERPLVYASGAFVISKRAWKKIPKKHRATVKNIVQKFGEKIIHQARADNKNAFERLLGSGGGLKKVPISDAKYQEFKKVGSAAWSDLAKSLKAEKLLTKARAVLGK